MQRKLHLYLTTRNDGKFLWLVYSTHRKKTQLERCSTPLQSSTTSRSMMFYLKDLISQTTWYLVTFSSRGHCIGDVEQMFHNFKVKIDHRDYLRFLWHPENDLDLPLKQYRMTVHVFGNRPSPAVATYGIRRCVAHSDPDVIEFVSNRIYVNDGLLSCPSEEVAADLMKRTQQALKKGDD